MGKPYALIGHVRFDKGEAMIVVSLLYCDDTNIVFVIREIISLLIKEDIS